MKFSTLASVSVSLGALLFGCREAPVGGEDISAPVVSPLSVPGAQMAAFRLRFPRHSPGEVAGRGHAFASTILGQSAPQAAFHAAVAAAPMTPSGLFTDVPGAPGIKMSYRPHLGEILSLNEAVTGDALSRVDVGEPTARRVFAGAFASLVSNGTLDSTGLDPANPRTAKIMQGEGRSGEVPVERVKEYIYTVPRRLNGIEVFASGVEIFVHRSGKLARIRSFGPTVDSTVTTAGAEAPSAGGYTFARAVSQGDLLGRAQRENAGAQVQSLGLSYFLPEGSGEALVEPTELFMVVPTATVDGHTVHGRAYLASYSVRDAAARPLTWPPAAVDAKGDPGK